MFARGPCEELDAVAGVAENLNWKKHVPGPPSGPMTIQGGATSIDEVPWRAVQQRPYVYREGKLRLDDTRRLEALFASCTRGYRDLAWVGATGRETQSYDGRK